MVTLAGRDLDVIATQCRRSDTVSLLTRRNPAQHIHQDSNRPSATPISWAGALGVFEQFLGQYPTATPEVIAVELITRADQSEEVAAIQMALLRILRSSTSARSEGTSR
jgi:hypothetical protein